MTKQRITSEEKIIIEAGYSQAYQPTPNKPENTPITPDESRLSQLKKGQRVQPRRVVVRRKAAPKGLSESDLIHLLQENGVGRPSTYAQVVAGLVSRRYAKRNGDGNLSPTGRGRDVCGFLVTAYPPIFTPAFTARMERELDAIAAGKASYLETITIVWNELNKER